MLKFVKKCVASVAALAMIATATAMPASAATDHVSVDTPYGTMDGYLDVWVSGNYKYVQGTTTCTSKVPMICVGIAIVSYPEGNPIYDYNNTTVCKENADFVSTLAYSLSKKPISAYGAHEVRGEYAYGDYTALTNV